MIKKIIVTGGDGRFAKELKRIKTNYNFIFRKKHELNILSLNSIENNFKKFRPDYILHLAGLSRPMSIHDQNIGKSIDLNIIGTANLVKACDKFKKKLIFFSTSYVYPGKKGNYRENDPLLPWNNYGWSKLGAEAAVRLFFFWSSRKSVVIHSHYARCRLSCCGGTKEDNNRYRPWP